jgi:DNA (cytosine-5)-methyltransferase 1
MNSLEIFSGMGGLAKGLEQAGFKHSAFVEFNSHACRSLRENFDSKKVFHGDIKDFDFDALESIDVVAGGPPCQPFSMGGKHLAHDDSRDMFPYAIKAIERLTPKAFIFENVKGLLRSSFSDYFDYILLRLTYPGFQPEIQGNWSEHLALLRRLKKMGYTGVTYRVQYKLLNAADYGVPQTRERVVIVGVRSDIDTEWIFPEETHSEDRLLWEMYVSGEYWKRHEMEPCIHDAERKEHKDKIDRLKSRYGMFEPTGLAWQTVRDSLLSVPDPCAQHGFSDHVYKQGARSYPGHTGSYIDWPSKTIKAGGHGVPGGENMIRYVDDTVRYFTVFEAKLLQTFSADFVVTGAWGEAMRQIGNAVPVKLASVLGLQIWKMLQPAAQAVAGSGLTFMQNNVTQAACMDMGQEQSAQRG